MYTRLNIPDYISFSSLNKTHQQACRVNNTIDIIPNWLYKDILVGRFREQLTKDKSWFYKWRHKNEIEEQIEKYNQKLIEELVW